MFSRLTSGSDKQLKSFDLPDCGLHIHFGLKRSIQSTSS